MRLELQGVDVKERARQLSSLWEKHNESFVSLFYEGHACFNNLLAGDTAANNVLMDNMRDYINDNRKVSEGNSELLDAASSELWALLIIALSIYSGLEQRRSDQGWHGLDGRDHGFLQWGLQGQYRPPGQDHAGASDQYTGQLGSEEHLQTNPGGGLHQVRHPAAPRPRQADPRPEHAGQEGQVAHRGSPKTARQDPGNVVKIYFMPS